MAKPLCSPAWLRSTSWAADQIMTLKDRTRQMEEDRTLARPEAMPAPRSIGTSAQSRYRMLVSDLDNTLLDEQKEFCQADLRAIKRLMDAGFIFTFATGRGSGSTAGIYRQLDPNAPVIIFNGARIVDFRDGGKVVSSSVMDRNRAVAAIGAAKEIGTTVLAFEGDNSLAEARDEWVDFYERTIKVDCLVVGDLQSHVTSLPAGMEITKLLFFSKPENRRYVVDEMRRRIPDLPTVATTPFYSEMLPPGVSKGSALKKLARYLGLELDEIVAVGDAPNDIEMIECAGFGAAVENADDIVKASADIIVRAVGRGGIAELINIAFGI